MTIRLDPALLKAMRAEAKRRGLSLSAWVRLLAQDEINRKRRELAKAKGL